MGSGCKIWCKLAQTYFCQCHYSVIFCTYCRKLIDIRCRVPWGLKGGVDSRLLFIASWLLHQSCRTCVRKTIHENVTRVPAQGVACFSNWVNSVGRKTRLIAVLTEIHERDRSYQPWPHCSESCELAGESDGETELPYNSLIIPMKTKANFAVAKMAAEGLRESELHL